MDLLKDLLLEATITVVGLVVLLGIVIGLGSLGEAVAGSAGFAAGLVLGLVVDAVLAWRLLQWRRARSA